MNAEQLNVIALRIQSEVETSRVLQFLTETRTHLQSWTQAPQEPRHQQSLSNTIDQLKRSVENSTFDGWAPNDKKIANEIGFDGLLGEELYRFVASTLSENQITPSAALNLIRPKVDQFERSIAGVNSLVESMETLGIGADDLEPGNAELGVTVPNDYTKKDVTRVVQELLHFEALAKLASEIVGEGRGPVELKRTASSDPSFWLKVVPAAAVVIASGIAGITTWYRNILDIRLKRFELKEKLLEANLPTESLDSVEESINTSFAEEISKLSANIIEEHGADLTSERRNELTIELSLRLNIVANRIDRGFDVEVRAEPDDAADGDPDEDSDGESDPQNEKLHLARDIAATIGFLPKGGAPILALPEKKPDSST